MLLIFIVIVPDVATQDNIVRLLVLALAIVDKIIVNTNE